MTSQVKCPNCKRIVSYQDTQHRHTVACPACQHAFVPGTVKYQEDRDAVKEMVNRFNWVLWIAFLSLPALFGWLEFQGVDFVNLGKQLEVDLLLKISMVLYYLSWSLGASWETSDMEAFYAVPPNRGRLPWGSFMAIGFLVGAGAILCLVHSFKWFAPALAGFWTLDYLGWIYLGFVVRPTVADSLNAYANASPPKYDKLESLLVFNELNQGVWKWWRGGVGLVLLVFVNLLAFTPHSQMLGDAAGGLPGAIVLAYAILGYILVIEGWIWFKRIQARNCYRLITNLSDKYDLSPKTPLAVAPSISAPEVVQPTPQPAPASS